MTVRHMPVACALDGHALSCRESDLRSSVLAEAQSVDRLPDGMRWTFKQAPDLFRRLGPIIDDERHCCRFLQVSIVAAPDLGTVTLEITGPAGTVDVLEGWISATP